MIISIDVGIKNLSLCKLNKKGIIQQWEVIDLSQDTPPVTCEYIGKKGKCKHDAKYTIADNHYFCNLHLKKSNYANCIAPEIYYKMLNKKISQKTVNELNKCYSLDDNSQDQLREYIYKGYATKITKPCLSKYLDLIHIGIMLSKKLSESIKDFENVNTILIENQISPIASRMKCIQGMISQYFIERGIFDIHFISSSNKLKHYDVPKKTYKERKKSCIIVTEELLSKPDNNNNTWLTLFENHKKKDDLADSYLQGLWFIHTKQIA